MHLLRSFKFQTRAVWQLHKLRKTPHHSGRFLASQATSAATDCLSGLHQILYLGAQPHRSVRGRHRRRARGAGPAANLRRPLARPVIFQAVSYLELGRNNMDFDWLLNRKILSAG